MLKGDERHTYTDGIILHAVAVSAPKGAILLLGHTGAGKTTLSRLLAERFPTLIDDNVYVAKNRINKKWYVTDVKYLHAGKGDYMPLLAAIRTFQAPQAKLISISSRELCKYLLDAIFETEMSKNYTLDRQRAWFAYSAEIARNYKGWRLSANLLQETPQLIWDYFEKSIAESIT